MTSSRLLQTLFMLILVSGSVRAQSVHYIPYRIGDKWVITNSMGEHLTNKLDYEIFPAMINRIKFKDGDKFGYLRSNGSVALPAIYTEATDFSPNTSKASVVVDDQWFHIDLYGDTTDVHAYSVHGRGWFDIEGYKIYYDETYRFGVDYRGEELLPAIYKDIKHPSGSNLFFFQNFKDKFGIVNSQGEYLSDCSLDSIQTVDLLNVFYFVLHKDGKMGVMNSRGAMIAPLKYDKLELYSVYGLCFAAYRKDRFLGYVYNGKEYWEYPN